MATLRLKALVDKENNRIIFVESDEHFIDVLFSFLTLPMGTIIRLIHEKTGIGCMNNLYESVQKLEDKYFHNTNCKNMLLRPRNASVALSKLLKVRIDGDAGTMFLCWRHKRASHFDFAAPCGCGYPYCLQEPVRFSVPPEEVTKEKGVFVKGVSQFLVSDELQVITPSTVAILSLLSKFGVVDSSFIEERTFDFGQTEALELLRWSLISNTPLTDTFLKRKVGMGLSKEDSRKVNPSLGDQANECTPNNKQKIPIKLLISKSKSRLCYAEASGDFVDLLFSFLTIPLGYVVKKSLRDGLDSKRCIYHLYNSIQNSESEKYLISKGLKEMLLSPKIAPCYGLKNRQLDIGEMSREYFYTGGVLTVNKPHILSSNSAQVIPLSVVDPKSSSTEVADGRGFVAASMMYTVTDDLVITPMSPVSGLFMLNKLNVPFNDIEERVVQVGTKEALRLLLAAFTSETALTDALLCEGPELQDAAAAALRGKVKQEI